MRLYQTPNGIWLGTEAAWKSATVAEGHDPKLWRDKAQIDVPTSKPELMDFLTFYHVNVINPPVRDIEIALAQPSPLAASVGSKACTTEPDLDALFEAAPIRQKLRLAVVAIDAVDALLFPR